MTARTIDPARERLIQQIDARGLKLDQIAEELEGDHPRSRAALLELQADLRAAQDRDLERLDADSDDAEARGAFDDDDPFLDRIPHPTDDQEEQP